MFKKVMLFVVLGIMLNITDLFSAERVIFSIENRRVDGDDYLFDVYADVPDPSNEWTVGPETIVIEYNDAGLSAYDYDGDNVASFDSELSGAGYVATQTDYSDGMVSFNIVTFSPSVDKSSEFMLGTIKLAIIDDTEYDDLVIETSSESVIYNDLDELTYGCSTSSCWEAETVTSQIIGGEPLGIPSLSSPSDNSTDISTSPTLSWNSVTDATSYDIQVSAYSNFSSTIVDDNVTSTSKSVSGLDYETTYYWRARAKNSNETSDWSSVWSFETEAEAVSGARVIFSIENRRVDGDDYLFDVYADVPDPSNEWTVGPETIVIEYNDAGLSAYDYDGDNVASFDSELSGAGYVATQTDYSDGMVSFNIVTFSPSVDKDSEFMLGTIKLAIIDDTEYDDLVIETSSESVIYNDLDELTYGCNTSSCWSAESVTSQVIGGGGGDLAAPTLSSPADDATNQSTALNLDWNSVSGASSYDIQLSDDNTFATTIVDDNVTSTSKSVSGLDYETTYYWRARALNSSETSNWSSVWSFTTEADSDEMHFSYTSTSIEMSIKIPADADLTLDGIALANGDEIGVFTQDGVCAGAVVWEEELVFFSAYGATSTPPVDGFDEDEEMIYKIWDASANEEYEASSVSHTDFLGNWINGEFDSSVPFKQLDELSAESSFTQTINFVSGWNLFSSYIVVSDPDVALVMEAVEDDMVIMRNDASEIYYPEGDYNQIGDFDNHDGYNAFFTTSASLDIEGTKIVPEDENISLASGWSLIGYLRDSDLNIETALADIDDNLLIARDGSSNIYYPDGGYNTIGDMKTGEGYQIYMTTTDNLTYPANGSGKVGYDYSHQITAKPEFLQLREQGTGISSVLIIEGLNIPDGIEIGAFSKDEELFGSGIVFNNQTVMTIHGDNEMTDYKDGFRSNEEIVIKAFDPENNQYTEMNLSEIRTVENEKMNTLRFVQNSVVYAKEGNAGNTYFASNRLDISPNPVNEKAKLSLSLKDNSNVTVEIYSASGQKLRTINNGSMTRGIHEMQINFADYASGLYTITVKLDNQVISANVIKVK